MRSAQPLAVFPRPGLGAHTVGASVNSIRHVEENSDSAGGKEMDLRIQKS